MTLYCFPGWDYENLPWNLDIICWDHKKHQSLVVNNIPHKFILCICVHKFVFVKAISRWLARSIGSFAGSQKGQLLLLAI